MKNINSGKQMTDVWRFPSISRWEKSCGKHPTQKPVPLLTRIILANTDTNDWILDPFAGSSTTGIAANLSGRRFLGIEKESEFVELSRKRRIELDNPTIFSKYRKHLSDLKFLETTSCLCEPEIIYGHDLPF